MITTNAPANVATGQLLQRERLPGMGIRDMFRKVACRSKRLAEDPDFLRALCAAGLPANSLDDDFCGHCGAALPARLEMDWKARDTMEKLGYGIVNVHTPEGREVPVTLLIGKCPKCDKPTRMSLLSSVPLGGLRGLRPIR
jgi:hypothetical protein